MEKTLLINKLIIILRARCTRVLVVLVVLVVLHGVQGGISSLNPIKKSTQAISTSENAFYVK